jgi:hypothetical protein
MSGWWTDPDQWPSLTGADGGITRWIEFCPCCYGDILDHCTPDACPGWRAVECHARHAFVDELIAADRHRAGPPAT